MFALLVHAISIAHSQLFAGCIRAICSQQLSFVQKQTASRLTKTIDDDDDKSIVSLERLMSRLARAVVVVVVVVPIRSRAASKRSAREVGPKSMAAQKEQQQMFMTQ